MKRVVITGIGAVSACGIGAERLWEAARDGHSGMRETIFSTLPRQHVKTAARMDEADVEATRVGFKPRFQDRVTGYALTAAREAVAQAGLTPDDFGASCGVVVGSGFGGAETVDNNYTRFASDTSVRIDPMGVPKTMTNSPASWTATEFGATGPCYCVSTACSSAGQSIGLGAQFVRAGVIDRCIVGGVEAMLVGGIFAGWEALHVMTRTLCRPFSKDRDGMVLGEGAGVIVIESADAARSRGAAILGELSGYGTNCDAGDLLRPDPESIMRCIAQAVEDAGIDPAEIGYVNAHGTGTVANDIAEATGIRGAFGNHFGNLAISSTKPIHGHALGAAGALEFIVTLRALMEQVAPPTINFLETDPKIGFDPVANGARPFSGRAALSNSFAFGGINSSLIISRFDG